MKILKALFSFLFIISLTVFCIAQTNDTRARGLFRSGQSDGMHILILQKTSEGKFVPADPSHTFQKGDQIRLAFESNFDGYVYIVNVTPGGKKRILYPSEKEANKIVRGQRYELPNTNTFMFDEEKGTEIVQVIMSREVISFFDSAIKNSGGELGETVSSAAAELSDTKTPQKGIVTENVTSVLPANTMRTRGIILAPGKDKNTEGSYVAIPDRAVGKPKTDKETGKLKSGEVAVFEIRLLHV